MTPEIRAWIASAPFRFAATMPENPHHYIVEREHGGPEFEAFVAAVKEHGARRRHRGWKLPEAAMLARHANARVTAITYAGVTEQDVR